MRKDKQKAFKLRLSGKSYGEISEILSVPKSTLSNWFSALELSEKVKEKILKKAKKKSIQLLIKRNKNQTKIALQRSINIRNEARNFLDDISKDNLFVIGVSLYWAEGYKKVKLVNGRKITTHPVSLTNADPELIRLFLRFLREICKVNNDKIKASLRMFNHQNESNLLKYWVNITGIKEENFGKAYVGVSKSSQGKRPYNQLPYGVLQVRVNNTDLFYKIMGWIDGLKKNSYTVQ